MTFQNPSKEFYAFIITCVFRESVPLYAIYWKNSVKMFLVLFLPEEGPFSITQEEPVVPD